MSRFSLTFAELHNPLFMNANFGTKLNPKQRTGMVLQYDTDLQAMIVEYQGSACLVFSANIASATVAEKGDIGLTPNSPHRTIAEPQHRTPIIQPTAPQSRPPMAPPLRLPPQQSAQVSHPARDAVDGVRLSSPPKYFPHSPMETQRAAQLAASGEIRPGAAAPTKSELQAVGKLLPDLSQPPVSSTEVSQRPAARRARKTTKTEPKVEG